MRTGSRLKTSPQGEVKRTECPQGRIAVASFSRPDEKGGAR